MFHVAAVGLIFVAVWFISAIEVLPATYFKFTYPSPDGISGRFVVTNETSGDSIAGGVLTETERAALTYWKGSANLDPGGYTVEGFIFETSDTSIGSYRIDIYLTDNDSMIIDMSSLSERPAIGDTIQRETSLATELAKALDSLADILDSLEAQSTWIQDSLYALLDTLQLWDTRIDSIEAALADASIGDKVWTDPGTRTITGGALTTPADYKADVSALALQAEVENIDGWNPATTAIIPKDVNESGDTLARLKDSLAFQGTASSLTAAVITDSVWNESQSEHTTAGTFGKYLDVEVSSALGMGDIAFRVYAIDTSGVDDTLTGIPITLQNATGSQLALQSTTDSGFFDFSVPTGTIRGLATLGATYVFPDTEWTVSGNDTVAIQGYNTTVSDPSDPAKSLVYATVYDVIGAYASDVIVKATRHTGIAADTAAGIIISPRTVYDTTDVSGYFSFPLIRTGQYKDTTMGFYDIIGLVRNLEVFRIDTLYVPPTGNIDLSGEI